MRDRVRDELIDELITSVIGKVLTAGMELEQRTKCKQIFEYDGDELARNPRLKSDPRFDLSKKPSNEAYNNTNMLYAFRDRTQTYVDSLEDLKLRLAAPSKNEKKTNYSVNRFLGKPLASPLLSMSTDELEQARKIVENDELAGPVNEGALYIIGLFPNGPERDKVNIEVQKLVDLVKESRIQMTILINANLAPGWSGCSIM